MAQADRPHDPVPAPTSSGAEEPTVLYSERHRVPLWWWIPVAIIVFLLSISLGRNRSVIWLIAGFIIFGACGFWFLIALGRTRIAVERDPDGSVWLNAGSANLAATAVSRSLAVPPSAKQAAMGRQLDPLAYVVYQGWIPSMVMLVLDDPNDTTPYWLVSTKNPEKLLRAFVPEQADAALRTMTSSEAA
ncbi:MAG: DUF3093 domain-containing protein [Corynebacterium sp.]|nr:DUF3093 domain-containing protein [Corynebacterium sp.]